MMPKAIKDSIWYVIERLGLPTFIVVAGGYWVGGHIADPLIKCHSAYLDQQVETTRQQAKTLEHIAQLIDEMQRSHDAQNVMLREILDARRTAAKS